MTEQATKTVTLFKTRRTILRIMTPKWGVLTFKARKYATDDPELERFIKEYLMVKEPQLGIYIDEAEPTFTYREGLSFVSQSEELQNLAAMQTVVHGGVHGNTGAKPTVASTGTNTANISQDLQASLKAKLAAQANKASVITPQDIGG